MKYAVIVVPDKDGYGAWSPDFLGCVALGDTVDEAVKSMKDAIASRIEGMKIYEETCPEPMSQCAYVAADGYSKKYAVVIEKIESSYSAYMPDIPGCSAIGDTAEMVLQDLKEALVSYFYGLKEAGEPIPEPIAQCAYIEPEISIHST